MNLRLSIAVLLTALLVSAASAQWFAATIPVPDSFIGLGGPQCLVWDSTDNKVFVGGSSGNRVFAVGGVTNRWVAKIRGDTAEVAIRRLLTLHARAASGELGRPARSTSRLVSPGTTRGRPARSLEHPESCRRFVGLDVRDEDAKRLARAPPDPPAQLMKLRQPELLGVFDQHHRRARDAEVA